MSPSEDQSLRLFLLGTLHAAGECGIPQASLLTRARADTFAALTLPELELQLRALGDLSYAVGYGTALGQQRWRITGRGRAALQEAGLA